MELRHSFTVPTSVEDAWALFLDLDKVGGCFPGATVTDASPDGFSGTVKVKLGPIALLYAGSGSFVEKDEQAHRAVIEAKGKDKRGNGTAGATVTIQLAPDGSGARADVTTDLSVTGKPAQFGRGVMQDVSDKLLAQFVACVERQLTGPSPSESATEAAVGAAADAAAQAPVGPADEASGAAPARSAPEKAPSVVAAGASRGGAGGPSRPPRAVPSGVEEAAALDLGSAVMPVLIQRYAGYAAAGVIGVLVGWLLGRRRSR
ncbi:MAG TPA: SRPBCC family protein [Intrasporangium sp.]|uniref:SRPBCC family protein n=1 Tax=Intrasporangium sp. TaxID=1925024 RepID=UPI002D79EF4E|nr:SRPBCC family protein [Intrasporangium sp.]HET7399166.1 SRPBCC family protein [Intrasporangium sp.]